MASDLKSAPLSVPKSRPRAATAAQPTTSSPPLSFRRPSLVMAPPMMSLPPTQYGGSPHSDAIGGGFGPLRHSKPLTPSDVHSMLEKEQEAMVNRLSRELSHLRQQTTSVASTTSSTSTTHNDPLEALHSPTYLTSSTHPSANRHRSSSSLSSSYIPTVQGSRGASVSGIAPSRDASLPGRSREASITSPRHSDLSLSSSVQQDYLSTSRNPTQQGTPPALSTSRYEEMTHHKLEYDSVKRENEALRRRVRDLEQTLKKFQEQGSKTDDAAQASPSALTNAMRNASVADSQ